MRQIALFTTDWNYELVGETLRGVLAFLEDHPDVCVRVFDCFSIDEQDVRDVNIYEIYTLLDPEQYDGAIVQTHQIVYRDVAGRLERQMRSRGIPAVSIGVPLGDMPQVRTDDYGAFYRITRHLAEKHQIRKFWFLKGPEYYDQDEQSEARQRRQGFQDACRELGIPENNIRFLEGSWKPASGEAAAREILALPPEERPDALICANDDMALGALEALRDTEIRVPEDLAVTGFDGIFSASLSMPRLATVDRNFQSVGYRAMETVLRMIDGETPPPVVYNDMRECLTGTCGCRGNVEEEVNRIKGRFYRQTQFLRHFYLTQDKIAGRFFSARSLDDVMKAIEEYSGIFGCRDLRIFLDERYYRSMTGGISPKEEARMSEGKYSGRFVMAADSRKRIAGTGDYRVVSAGGTQSRMEEGRSAAERLIQYYPLSYGPTMVGVLMLRGFCEAADMNLHESLVNEMVLTLDNIRQHENLKRLNQKLNDLYVTDQLTGLNNRFGVARYGQPLFDRLRAAGEGIDFIFLDVDEMKEINDRFGHEAGDEALRMTAEVMRRACQPGDFLMRYGGDEFVAFGPAAERNAADRIFAELERIQSERDLPFRLSLSLGEFMCQPDSGLSLDSCLQSADLRMYEVKKQNKRENRR